MLIFPPSMHFSQPALFFDLPFQFVIFAFITIGVTALSLKELLHRDNSKLLLKASIIV